MKSEDVIQKLRKKIQVDVTLVGIQSKPSARVTSTSGTPVLTPFGSVIEKITHIIPHFA